VHRKEKAKDSWSGKVQNFFDCDKVFETFRHFELVNMQMTDVNEVLHPMLLAEMGLGLCDFVFVMRENQIHTS
jgi:hypothetical protein